MASETKPQESSIQRLRAAVADGRTTNIRYRQTQLQKLHAALTENADALAEAITRDTQGAISEVEAELFLTMDSLRHFYDSLDFAKEMEDEYLITNGKDNASRKIGVGLVLIRPTCHTRLYSVLSPIFTAIAAGNCVLLELEPTILNIDTHLKTLLSAAMDQDTFAITTKRINEKDIAPCLLLDQTRSSLSTTSMTNELLSSNQARTIAIVDRTANIDAAAQAIVTAKFSFQGTSPYAPDLVIVNEFVKKDFFEACTRCATQLFVSKSTLKRTSLNSSAETRKAIEEAEDKGQLSTFGSSDFTIADVSDRACSLTKMKVSGYYLPIVPCSSITDAVFNQDIKTTFLAGYFFASPSAAKFISQHLDCHMTFVNQIPTHLLAGPAAPISHPPSYPYRYTIDMFSITRPQFIKPPHPSLLSASEILALSNASKISATEIRKLGMRPLKPTGQAQGVAIGFFEQGIITGAVILFGIILPAVAYGSWVFGRRGWDVLRKLR